MSLCIVPGVQCTLQEHHHAHELSGSINRPCGRLQALKSWIRLPGSSVYAKWSPGKLPSFERKSSRRGVYAGQGPGQRAAREKQRPSEKPGQDPSSTEENMVTEKDTGNFFDAEHVLGRDEGKIERGFKP